MSYNGCLSADHNVSTGVPQGSILGPLLFLVHFNDVIEASEHSSIVKYADDTILYVARKDIQSIQTKLSKDMDSLADWLRENELIINLKRGKTESLLFGTAQRIAKHSEPLKVSISRPSPTVITTTEVYKYLGVLVDSSLNLNSNFDSCYKRAAGRLRLLEKLRIYLDQAAANAIYCSMILPTLAYCGILHLQLTQTQINKLSSFYDRAVKVVFKNGNVDQDHNLPSAINVNKIRACKVVRKCLNNDICEHFKDYFTLQNHAKHTRNNRHF